MVAKQIGLSREEDKYGSESLSQRVGYEVYRFRGVGLMVFHESNPLWELGLIKSSFIRKNTSFNLRVIFHRFLSLEFGTSIKSLEFGGLLLKKVWF
jgi:hypothetical protein